MELSSREGAIEGVACILQGAGLSLLCYVVFFITPVLARMSDQRDSVRLMASRCFASLVTLMPLEVSPWAPEPHPLPHPLPLQAGVPSPAEMPRPLAEQRQRERDFLEQLLDSSKLDSYSLSIPIDADLRKYQQVIAHVCTWGGASDEAATPSAWGGASDEAATPPAGRYQLAGIPEQVQPSRHPL